MEIEAKFSFRDPAALAAWRSRPSLGPFTLGPERTALDVDRYVDSADRACLKGGYACRIRDRDGRTLVTLKSLASSQPVGVSGEPSIRRREEYEVELIPSVGELGMREDGSLPDWQQPLAWPASEARALALRLLDGRPLQHVATVYQERHERDVLDGDRRLATLSLDRVRFANGQPEMWELEVELTSDGSEEDLSTIVACLRDDPDFEPETRSKLQRALDGIAS